MRLLDYKSSNTDKRAILEEIDIKLIAIKNLLDNKKLTPGDFKLRVVSVKYQFKKIYGEESDIIKFFPSFKEKISIEELPYIANDFIKRIENISYTLRSAMNDAFVKPMRGKIFIGHGRSPLWRDLKDFISERLKLDWDEFNREPVAGFMTFERLTQMLSEAMFAFLIMTAEDEHADASLHARENVIHEVGLFQGHLGQKKAIILLEEGCKEFSNILGLSQIRFPKGVISASYEEIRRVLEREGIITSSG